MFSPLYYVVLCVVLKNKKRNVFCYFKVRASSIYKNKSLVSLDKSRRQLSLSLSLLLLNWIL